MSWTPRGQAARRVRFIVEVSLARQAQSWATTTTRMFRVQGQHECHRDLWLFALNFLAGNWSGN